MFEWNVLPLIDASYSEILTIVYNYTYSKKSRNRHK